MHHQSSSSHLKRPGDFVLTRLSPFKGFRYHPALFVIGLFWILRPLAARKTSHCWGLWPKKDISPPLSRPMSTGNISWKSDTFFRLGGKTRFLGWSRGNKGPNLACVLRGKAELLVLSNWWKGSMAHMSPSDRTCLSWELINDAENGSERSMTKKDQNYRLSVLFICLIDLSAGWRSCNLIRKEEWSALSRYLGQMLERTWEKSLKTVQDSFLADVLLHWPFFIQLVLYLNFVMAILKCPEGEIIYDYDGQKEHWKLATVVKLDGPRMSSIRLVQKSITSNIAAHC